MNIFLLFIKFQSNKDDENPFYKKEIKKFKRNYMILRSRKKDKKETVEGVKFEKEIF